MMAAGTLVFVLLFRRACGELSDDLESQAAPATLKLKPRLVEGVCDIFAAGGTPCVAAHSLTRALYANYSGALYRIRNGRNGREQDVHVLRPGGVANVNLQTVFCGSTICTVQMIYDQSGRRNHLKRETGFPYLRPPRNSRDSGVNLTGNAKVSLGGASVYGAVFETHCDVHECPTAEPHCCDGKFAGYANRTAEGTAVRDQPQTVYALFDGKHYNGGCCFDYGNAEKARPPGANSSGMNAGAMEAVYFGCGDHAPPLQNLQCKTGPYVYSDLETMHHMMTEPGFHPKYLSEVDFLAAMVKGRPGRLAMLSADAQRDQAFSISYDGPYPEDFPDGGNKQGAIVLGIGGDNSPWGSGTWFEGAMTVGYTSDETDTKVLANVVEAGYQKLQ